MHVDRRSAAFDLLVTSILAAACVAVFGQTVHHEFITIDDGLYLARNAHVLQGLTADSARWALTAVVVSNWHPLTMYSHLAAVEAFGAAPGPHHAINVALHALNVILLYAWLVSATRLRWEAAAAALLFAVHPLRVESVAWVTERKGLLCGMFGLLTLLAYQWYSRRPGALRMAATASLFTCGLLSKPALVALPFALLLIDIWPLERMSLGPDWQRHLRRRILEKWPLFAITAAFSVVTYVTQRDTGAVQGLGKYSVPQRVANTVSGYAMYLNETFLPIRLAPQHPLNGEINWTIAAASALALVLVTAGVIAYRRAWPWLLVGWFWYLGMLVPVIGLIQVAHQARADRYTYLPQIGILIAIVWSLGALRKRSKLTSMMAAGVVGAISLILGLMAFEQTALWRDNFTLFTHTIKVAPESAPAHYGLAVDLLERGDFIRAEAELREATSLEPPLPEAFSNLGAILYRKGAYDEAAPQFARAIELHPDSADLHTNYGAALFSLGRYSEALIHAKTALRLLPSFARAEELRNVCEAALEGAGD